MGVIENAKEIGDLVKKMGNIDLYRKIVALEEEVIDLTREKRQLEEKVAGLDKALQFSKNLKFKEPFYWVEGDETPYCAPCWELKHNSVHLKKLGVFSGKTRWDCPVCTNAFHVDVSNPGHRSY